MFGLEPDGAADFTSAWNRCIVFDPTGERHSLTTSLLFYTRRARALARVHALHPHTRTPEHPHAHTLFIIPPSFLFRFHTLSLLALLLLLSRSLPLSHAHTRLNMTNDGCHPSVVICYSLTHTHTHSPHAPASSIRHLVCDSL